MFQPIYLIVFIGCVFLSRIILNKAYQKLSSEEKVQLTDLFSVNSTYTYIGVFISFLIYFLLIKFNVFDSQLIINFYISGLLVYLIVKYIKSNKKLKEYNFSQAYLNAYLYSRIVSFIGFLVILFSINFN